ncbi:TonB-dependent receptor [Pseudoxanthomonas sp.]|uniref:TonB-dependent receptor n=1 Tax=Pseudoxanthomonas sp. TaxID=1871049 RepID=UPI00262CACB7|nr:TonB-dependent receptor [Pseudoxanthomonas sp.]WDS36555.1 MAG: TonB-dependent receptor [Pseudoxanthomonas sp.]
MRRILFLSIALALHAGQASAQPSDTAEAAIPAQPLDHALNVLAKQSGLQFIYNAKTASGLNSPGATGGLSPERALQQLLARTGLRYRYITHDTVTLEADTPEVNPDSTDTSKVSTASAAGDSARVEPVQLDEVKVTGSFAGALGEQARLKRYADSVVDAIAAEDIGKLPAQNVAEALQRVPGVAIERDRGEGVYVRVRGLGANFQVTTLDGQSMAVNENVRTSGQTGRQFRYDTLPAELVSRLEVIKSPTADRDEGAIGGIVDIHTFKPLELGKTLFTGSIENSHPQLADANDPRMSGLFNWVNHDGTFGMLVSAAYSQRHLRQDRVNEVSYDYVEDTSTTGGAHYIPTGIRPTLELENRTRAGATASFQWRPSDRLDLGLDLFYTRQTVHYDEYSLGMGWDLENMSNIVVSNGGITGFDYDDAQVQLSRETSGITDENRSAHFTGRWNGDLWTLDGSLFHSTAHSWDSDPIRRTRLRTSASVDMSVSLPSASGSNVPSVTFADYDPDSTGDTPGRRLEWRSIDAMDKESAIQLDAQRELGDGFFRNFKAGVKYRDRSRDYQRRDLQLTSGISGVYFDASDFTALPVDDFLSGTRGSLPTSWLAPVESAFWGDWPTIADLADSPTAADLQNSYTVKERIASGYLMAEFEGALASRALRGNAGVRLVQTHQTTDGYADVDGDASPVHYQRSYINVLPSLNAAWELRDDMLLRGAVAKVMTRPDLTDLSSKLTFNSGGSVLEASGGNPNLKPYQAWQYDLSWEWYYGSTSALTAGVFYKDISSFIQTQYSYLDYQGLTYLLNSKTNGSKASVKGAELAWQQVFTGLPAPLDGLGIQLNYTWTDSQARYSDSDGSTFEDALEGVAKNSYNATLFYEKGPLQARVSYSWLDDVLNAVGTADVATLNDDAFGSLDASVSWRVNDHLTAYASGINLTNAVQRQYVGDHLFGGYTDYGRTVSFGLRVRF